MADLPRRELRDPRALRAIAHPLRLRILDELAFGGPATATELGGRIGESAANCSWHLRQLARYGWVEEAGGGTGRQRPWRVILQSNTWGQGEEDPELAMAGDAASQVLLSNEFDALRGWLAGRRAEPARWRDAGFFTQYVGWLTAEELSAAEEEITGVFRRYFDRVTDPARRPPGARPIRFVAWGVPARPIDHPDRTEESP
jgi:DNA-binding transcriptional ArsR family regulator